MFLMSFFIFKTKSVISKILKNRHVLEKPCEPACSSHFWAFCFEIYSNKGDGFKKTLRTRMLMRFFDSVLKYDFK